MTPTYEEKKHWLLVVEDSSDYAWSYFLKVKLVLRNVMLGFIKEFKSKYGIQVKYAQCVNAGENEDFERACKQEGISIKVKYPTLGTPQQVALLNGNLLLSLKGDLQCSNVGSFVLL